ncbi:lytic polysaccharide monooxygenase [Glonium stellatum]|uniref:lytic cellulose monooxygenase (C4-dehydrogenating) n=1 Tax=Glonium stellatum TaxID=574774 RepID=A0A8E2JUY4_9PEZI|nr:lytic polysaccharide monooxygenase [Glonium stellatum]
MKYLITLLSSAALVAAHGYVDNATINGVHYQPYYDPYVTPARVSRPIQGNGPIADVTYVDLQCGGWTEGEIIGSSPAALHAPATAGSTVTLHWTLWPDSHRGPVVTYMARCPNTGCNDWLPGTAAVWFKVAETGRIGVTDTWGDTPLMVTGTGSTTPSSFVAFPGAYQGSDPGITYDMYQAQTYTIPGPSVFQC